MNPELLVAIDEIKSAFPESGVDYLDNGDGSIWVTVSSVYIGKQWVPSSSTISFGIGAQYPYAECYPHYLDPSLKKADGSPHGEAIHPNNQTPRGDAAVMVSRVNRQFGDVPDTAAIKLVKVVDWLRSRE